MQFFNRPALVLPLVHRGMLHTMLDALSHMMREAAASDGVVAMCPLFARRRYLPLISDLRFVLAIPGVPAYLLSQPELVERWAGQLSRLQLLDSQPRVAQHGQSDRLGSAPARPLCLLSARPAALGSLVLPEWGPGHWAPRHRLGCSSEPPSKDVCRCHCL